MQQVAADNSVDGFESHIIVGGANWLEVNQPERGGRHRNSPDFELGNRQDVGLELAAADADVHIVLFRFMDGDVQGLGEGSVEATVVGTGVDEQADGAAVQPTCGDDMKTLRV